MCMSRWSPRCGHGVTIVRCGGYGQWGTTGLGYGWVGTWEGNTGTPSHLLGEGPETAKRARKPCKGLEWWSQGPGERCSQVPPFGPGRSSAWPSLYLASAGCRIRPSKPAKGEINVNIQ